MTRSFRYTLLTDGSSDDNLRFPINWLLRDLGWLEGNGDWADFRFLREPPRTLDARIAEACRLYPCEILFVHRDAETTALEARLQEIEAVIATSQQRVIHVCVVPVRMVEAWLLHDEAAIRRAAGNPNGLQQLDLPNLTSIEGVPDPKAMLEQALLDAVADRGRRRRRAKQDFGKKRRRVAEYIEDFSPLRQLSAFASFEHRLTVALARL